MLEKLLYLAWLSSNVFCYPHLPLSARLPCILFCHVVSSVLLLDNTNAILSCPNKKKLLLVDFMCNNLVVVERNNHRFLGTVYVNLIQFSFSVKADVRLTFVPIHIMLLEDCDDFTVGHPDVAVELKVPRQLGKINWPPGNKLMENRRKCTALLVK